MLILKIKNIYYLNILSSKKLKIITIAI
jgi:hypothetical protein